MRQIKEPTDEEREFRCSMRLESVEKEGVLSACQIGLFFPKKHPIVRELLHGCMVFFNVVVPSSEKFSIHLLSILVFEVK